MDNHEANPGSYRLKPVGLVWTPPDLPALEEWVGRLAGSEAALANVVMLMTWNLCAKLTDPDWQPPMTLRLVDDETTQQQPLEGAEGETR